MALSDGSASCPGLRASNHSNNKIVPLTSGARRNSSSLPSATVTKRTKSDRNANSVGARGSAVVVSASSSSWRSSYVASLDGPVPLSGLATTVSDVEREKLDLALADPAACLEPPRSNGLRSSGRGSGGAFPVDLANGLRRLANDGFFVGCAVAVDCECPELWDALESARVCDECRCDPPLPVIVRDGYAYGTVSAIGDSRPDPVAPVPVVGAAAAAAAAALAEKMLGWRPNGIAADVVNKSSSSSNAVHTRQRTVQGTRGAGCAHGMVISILKWCTAGRQSPSGESTLAFLHFTYTPFSRDGRIFEL